MKRKKIGIIASAVATSAICASMIAGSTFALFTSSDEVNMTVTAGNVSVDWNVKNAKVFRATVDPDTGAVVGEYAETTEATATFNKAAKSLSIDNIVAGDKVEFDLVVENTGSVTACYQYSINATSGFALLKDITWTIDDMLTETKALTSYTSVWNTGFAAKTSDTYHITLNVDGKSEANGAEANIDLNLMAVQGNAKVDETAEAVVETIPEGATVAEVVTVENLKNALNIDNAYVALVKPIEVAEQIIVDGNDVCLNLNSNALSRENAGNRAILVQNGGHLTVTNGTIDYNASAVSGASIIYVLANSSATIDNVIIQTNMVPLFAQQSAAKVEVRNSDITGGWYAIGTNASTTDQYVTFDLKDSSFSVTEMGGTPVFVSVNSTVNIDNCDINGKQQAVLVRNGKVTITNSRLTNTMETEYHYGTWGSGTAALSGVLVAGCGTKYSANYGDIELIVENCTLTNKATLDCVLCVYNDGYHNLNFNYENLTVNAVGMTAENTVIFNNYAFEKTELTGTLTINGTVLTSVKTGL